MTARSRNFHSLLRHLAIPALGCLVGCGLGRGAIEGRVVAPDGSPLAGAQVTVLGADPNLLVAGLERSKWTTTDASGRFKVRLPAGSFELAITHGTHEFIQLKHRLLRAMSADPGPLLLGLEMNQAAGFALDDWAVTGQGEPWSSLPPTLLTEDLRDLLLWVRARNQASGTAAAIRLGGFDVHGPRAPYEWALSFLRQVDAAEASFLATHLHDLVGAPWQGPPQAPGTVEAWRAALERLQHQARQRRQRWLARSSPVAFDRYQRCLVLLEQGTRLLEGGVQRVSTREKAMADNVHWLLSAAAPDARVVLWAHNGHISKSPTGRAGFAPMGWYLAQTLGAAYLPIGLVFHEGGFAGVTAGQPGAHTVAPMAADTLGRALVASGLPLLALDLRQLPAHGRVG